MGNLYIYFEKIKYINDYLKILSCNECYKIKSQKLFSYMNHENDTDIHYA